MDIDTLNSKLAIGEVDLPSMFPHLAYLEEMPYQFDINFGLTELPTEPGILIIRGARQYGKSTWLEQQVVKSFEEFGPGSVYYLNGDNLLTADNLEKALEDLLIAFSKTASIRRIFIDEITAIDNWEIALKRMADREKLRHILLITTGSKATDLRRGTEKLPGRKGKLARTHYLFTPISYSEFHKKCGAELKSKTLIAYLISGGSPIACAEIAKHGYIPEYVIELVRDWIDGEISASGRSRASLFNIMNVIYRLGGTAVGQAKLARESGLANNTVASGYIEILNDLGCVIPAFPLDPQRKQLILRKPCKYHMTNLLAAVAYMPDRLRSIEDFENLSPETQGIWYEWLIAQELQRRSAINGRDILEPLSFWENKRHELDFVLADNEYLEVKRGKCSPIEFSWFPKQLPNSKLHLLNKNIFETDYIDANTIEYFLLSTP